ncbi:hypothetical protein KSF78_0004127 [Schistosoma japonicum]|nr:hypothetical protein KSF78_0004127 [Schistosoma japonicum]
MKKDASTQINKILLNENIPNDNDVNVEQNNEQQINDDLKMEFTSNLYETTEKALDLSLSSKQINNRINKHFFKRQNHKSLNKQQQQHQQQQQQRCHNKRYSYRKRIKQLTFSGIYKLIHPITKHCYTVKIIPIKQ